MRYRKIVNWGIKLEFGKESTGERYGGMNKNIKKTLQETQKEALHQERTKQTHIQ